MCLFRGFLFNMCLFRSFLFNICLSRGFLFNMCLFRGFYIIYASFGAIDLSILNWSIVLMVSSKVPSFSWVLLFQGITSFELIGQPCFKRILDSFVNYPLSRKFYHVLGVSYIHLLFVLQGHQSVLEYLQSGYMTLSLSLFQWMHLVIDLQDFVNKWSFELLVHIDLYEDQDESKSMHSK